VRIGNIVEYQDKRWLVTGQKPGRLCVLRTWEGTEVEVPEQFDKDATSGLKIVGASQTWPFLTAPMRGKEGPVTQVTIMRDGRQRVLQPLTDWVPASLHQPGGALYFNPSLHLQRGEILVASRKSGKMDRLVVNAGFLTLRQRQRRATMATQTPTRSVYDHLLDDDEDL